MALAPAEEYAALVQGETQSARYIEANEAEQARCQKTLADLEVVTRRNQKTVEELSGFRRKVVSFVLYRTVRRQLVETRQKTKDLKADMQQRAGNLKEARVMLENMKKRRAELTKELQRGTVIKFKRKS